MAASSGTGDRPTHGGQGISSQLTNEDVAYGGVDGHIRGHKLVSEEVSVKATVRGVTRVITQYWERLA